MRSYRTTDPSATDEDLIVALFRRTEEEVPVLPPGTPVLLQGMSVRSALYVMGQYGSETYRSR